MLDGVSLDQIHTFIAAADAGSFSAAGRRLGRAQSVVSKTLANLEAQLGVVLFDRSGRIPVLTAVGRSLLSDARAVVTRVDGLKAHVKFLKSGLETEVSVLSNMLFPNHVLAASAADFHREFPDTVLHIGQEALGAVLQPVIEGRCTFGIRGPLATDNPLLTSEHVADIHYVMVASPRHPLASSAGPIPTPELASHVQLVLSDRSQITTGTDFRVFSHKTWRVSDLSVKHAVLLAGMGWGGMPLHMIEDDLKRGTLKTLTLEEMASNTQIPLAVVYRSDVPPGLAGRWLITRLKDLAKD